MKPKAGLLADLFCGPGNFHWDLGRKIVAFCFIVMGVATVWNMVIGQPIDLGPGGLGGGLAAVLGASAAIIAAKDAITKWVKRKLGEPEAPPGDEGG